MIDAFTPDEGMDDGPEIIDGPMRAEELAILQRDNANYVIPIGVNPLHEEWTDNEVILLSHLWDTEDPLSRKELERRLVDHPVLVARPGREYFTDALHAYTRYCRRQYLQSKDVKWLITCEKLCIIYVFIDITDRLDADRMQLSDSRLHEIAKDLPS